MSKDKKNNVVGIGHNQNNDYSKEQYAKLVNSLHRMLKYSQQEIKNVGIFLDQAFTKYPLSNPNKQKLKEFQIHESRQRGKDIVSAYCKKAEKDIATVEANAKDDGIELELGEAVNDN